LPSEWASDAHVDRDKIDRARKNAEDLFKPRPQPEPVDTVAPAENSVPSSEAQPRRQPRIFSALPAAPMKAAEVETRAQPKPTRLRRRIRRETGTIPESQFGRIRTLTSYGMTQAQVAELYGVSVDEIERIVREPNSSPS
jgi:DNA-binding transcriptional regulator YiaG